MTERGRDAAAAEMLVEAVAALLEAGAELATPAAVAACVEAGRVFVDGRRLLPTDGRLGGATEAEPLQAGQRVELREQAQNSSVAPLVLGERWGLLAVLKPSGLASEPDRRGTDSVVSRVAQQLGREVHAVSRLDAQVSGVMLMATDDASRKLAAGLKPEAVERHYIGLVAALSPRPSPQLAISGTWRAAIGDGARGRRQVGGRGARPAVTHFRELQPLPPQPDSGAGCAIWRRGHERHQLRCLQFGFQLETGRTHQIRVHAAHAGFPLLGDVLYAGPSSVVLPGGNVVEFDRIALHASELHVRHAGDTWSTTTAMPEVLNGWLKQLSATVR